MADELKFIVRDARVHQDTGFVEVDSVAVKETANSKIDGPLRTYGIDAAALQSGYGGDVKAWLAAMKGQHAAYAGHHDGLTNEVLALKGKEI